MPSPVRNRIKCHRRVRAGDLLPHELNFRLHPDAQRAALEALYAEVGFARSLLAYELPDGRLKLIDGHLRRDLDPDMEVDVEVLDVNDEEARALLLSIDPLAALAETQTQLHDRLLELTPAISPDLQAMGGDGQPDPVGDVQVAAAGLAAYPGAIPGLGDVPRRAASGGAAGTLRPRGAGVQGAVVMMPRNVAGKMRASTLPHLCHLLFRLFGLKQHLWVSFRRGRDLFPVIEQP
jgi:hypothetical protein